MTKNATPDPLIEELIIKHSQERGITRRTITDQEITERAIYAMINEGAKILEEGIATRPLDIDVVWIYGYGFPVYRRSHVLGRSDRIKESLRCSAEIPGLGWHRVLEAVAIVGEIG
jgi:hypothetical protein